MEIIYNKKCLDCIKEIESGMTVLKDIKLPFSTDINFENYKSQNSLYIYKSPNISVVQKTHLVLFDLDWTITYSAKHLFPNDPDDVELLPDRVEKLEEIIKSGYTIAIFTNQYAKTKSEKLKKLERIRNFLLKLRLPILVYISTEKDQYRKPEVGMLDAFFRNEDISREMISEIFYVGDALGRPQDFSDSDKLFAENYGIPYISPDDFFKSSGYNISFLPQKELVVFVGPPGSNKTSYYRKYLSSTHIHINQDTLKTKAKVLKEFEKVLSTNKSIVIDSTNPQQETRNEYYRKAQSHGYNIKVLYFLIDGHGWNKLREKPVPDIVYHTFYKKLDVPTEQNTPGELYYISSGVVTPRDASL